MLVGAVQWSFIWFEGPAATSSILGQVLPAVSFIAILFEETFLRMLFSVLKTLRQLLPNEERSDLKQVFDDLQEDMADWREEGWSKGRIRLAFAACLIGSTCAIAWGGLCRATLSAASFLRPGK